MMKDDHAPRGLTMLHSTQTVAEAELLRQVLIEEGYRIEHVPSAGTGVFGSLGNNTIYVPDEQYAAANEFLQQYLNAEPIWEMDPADDQEPQDK